MRRSWRDSHECEADPLDAQLRYPEQAGDTVEGLDLGTAGNILARLREKKDVGESRCSRCRTEQDEIWRNSLRGSARNDSEMLREVADEHAHDDEAVELLALRGGLVCQADSSSGLPYIETMRLTTFTSRSCSQRSAPNMDSMAMYAFNVVVGSQLVTGLISQWLCPQGAGRRDDLSMLSRRGCMSALDIPP